MLLMLLEGRPWSRITIPNNKNNKVITRYSGESLAGELDSV